jgi:hypothetical protein
MRKITKSTSHMVKIGVVPIRIPIITSRGSCFLRFSRDPVGDEPPYCGPVIAAASRENADAPLTQTSFKPCRYRPFRHTNHIRYVTVVMFSTVFHTLMTPFGVGSSYASCVVSRRWMAVLRGMHAHADGDRDESSTLTDHTPSMVVMATRMQMRHTRVTAHPFPTTMRACQHEATSLPNDNGD